MLVDCAKEELTTDGAFIVPSVCLSVCPTQAPPCFPASVFHINALSFVRVYMYADVTFNNTEQKQWLPFNWPLPYSPLHFKSLRYQICKTVSLAVAVYAAHASCLTLRD
jgi:hypothetical protein